MSVQLTNIKLSKAKLWSNENLTDALAAIVLLAQNDARATLSALSPTSLTNDTGASDAGPVAAVPTGLPFQYGGGATYAPRAGFNTAIGTVDNALATLATYLNTNVFTPLSSPDSIIVDAGTVTANTLAAITTSLTGTDGAADKATGSITLSTAEPADGDTITIGTKTYTFQTSLTNVDGNILIGGSLTAAATNLFNAINNTGGGTPGTDYAAAMTTNTSASATNPSAGVVDLTAKTGGTAGNSITLSRTFTTGANCTLSAFAGGAQDTAMLRSDMNAAVVGARNNFATILKAYNEGASYVSAPSIMDASGGVADTNLSMYNQATATNVVTSTVVASTDAASLSDAQNALAALAADISFVADSVNGSLLSVGVLTLKNNVLIVP